MTIAERNRVRLLTLTVMGIITLYAGAEVFFIFKNSGFGLKTQSPDTIFTLSTLTAYSKPAICLSILAFPLFSTVLLTYLYILFKKTHAIEISFFVIYLFCMSFECLRLVFPLRAATNMASENIAVISRIVYTARLTGIISLFISSIFAIKVMTRQIAYVTFFSFFVAFSLVFSMPVNNYYSDSYFFTGSAYYYPYTYMSIAAGVLTCITYTFAYISKNAHEYLYAAAALLCSIAGYWLLIYTQSFAALSAGTVLFVGAIIIFLKKIHSYHIWQ